MENSILKLIYLIVHMLVDCIETIFYFGLEFRDKFFNFINNSLKEGNITSSANEKVIIERNLQSLKKIPQHIAVILNIRNKGDVELSKLVDLIHWSLISGINFISFYDFKGNYKLTS